MKKGNKHAGKRAYKKHWVGSKAWKEAQRAKKRYHEPAERKRTVEAGSADT